MRIGDLIVTPAAIQRWVAREVNLRAAPEKCRWGLVYNLGAMNPEREGGLMGKLAATILTLLSCCAVATAQVKPQADNSKIEVALPSESWTLVFDAPGFKASINGLQPDGRAYLMAENKSTGVTLSAYLEKVSGGATADGCKENQKQRLEQKVPYKRENLTTRESGGMTVLEFTIAEFNGVPVQQRNLFACMAKDDVYVDIHLSKVLFKASQEELFNAVLNSVHFVDKPSSN